MSGLRLVGYGSSDEEDAVLPQGAPAVRASGISTEDSKVPLSTKNPPGSGVVGAAREEPANGTIQDGQIVGPAMPVQLNDNGDPSQGQPSPGLPQQMSDRETIHYLTQATHPMTSIPPSPPGSPDPALNAKFKRFLELKGKGIHFNEELANKSAYRNPGLLTTMMMRAGLESDDQYRTSLPLDVFDPTGFPPSAYKEELLRSQQLLKEQKQTRKKTLSVAGRRTVEFTSGGTSTASSRESTPGMPSKRGRRR